MKKAEKEMLQDMLQDISYAYEDGDGDFWPAWSKMQKSLSEMEEEPEGRRVFDINWSSDGEGLPGEAYVPEELPMRAIKGYLESEFGEEVSSFWTLTDDEGLFTQTPSGPIVTKPYRDGDYVGTFLLYSGEGSGEPGVLMEHDPDEDRILLKVWSKEYPEDDPRYVLPMN